MTIETETDIFDIKIEIQENDDNVDLKCPQCNKEFKSKQSKRVHFRIVHLNTKKFNRGVTTGSNNE